MHVDDGRSRAARARGLLLLPRTSPIDAALMSWPSSNTEEIVMISTLTLGVVRGLDVRIEHRLPAPATCVIGRDANYNFAFGAGAIDGNAVPAPLPHRRQPGRGVCARLE